MAEYFGKYVSFRNAFFVLSFLSLIYFPFLSRNAGMSGDEELHFTQSEKVYNYFASHGEDKSAIHTPGTHLKYYGQAFDNITTILIKWFNIKNVYQFRHICNSLAGWATIFIAGLLTVSLMGYRAGFIALILFLVSARFIGHSWNNLKDIPFALGYLTSIFLMIQFIRKIPKPPIYIISLLILSISFTIGIRIGGILLICYLFLFTALFFLYNYFTSKSLFNKKVILQTAILLIFISISGYFLGLLLWPFALEKPLQNPWISYKAMTQFPTTLRQIFEGEMYWSDQFPWYYLLKYMGITIPSIVLAGLGLFIVYSRKIITYKNWIYIFFLIFTIIFPLFFIIAGKSNVYGAWRHVVFVYPPLVVLSAIGIDCAFTCIKKRTIRIISLLILIILLLHPLRFMVKNHPYEYLYFNEFTGGLGGAYGKYETDYYFHSVREASEWLQEYFEENDLYSSKEIEVGLNFPAGEWFFRDNVNKINTGYLKYYSRGNLEWDFAIVVNSYIHPNQLREKTWPPENTIHTVDANGIPICAILERKTWNDYFGYKALKKGQLNEATQLLLNARELDSGNESVLINLSSIYINSLKLDSAKMVLDECLNIYPDYEPAIHQSAKLKHLQGNTDEAIVLYKYNLENNYKYFPSYIDLANIYFESSHDDLAVNYLKKCLSVNPYYKPALLALGKHYQEKGEIELAEKYLNSAKKL